LAEKIAGFTIPQLAQLIIAKTKVEFQKRALIEIGKRALGKFNLPPP
jgi:hypothetical protein